MYDSKDVGSVMKKGLKYVSKSMNFYHIVILVKYEKRNSEIGVFTVTF